MGTLLRRSRVLVSGGLACHQLATGSSRKATKPHGQTLPGGQGPGMGGSAAPLSSCPISVSSALPLPKMTSMASTLSYIYGILLVVGGAMGARVSWIPSTQLLPSHRKRALHTICRNPWCLSSSVLDLVASFYCWSTSTRNLEATSLLYYKLL